MTRDPYEVLGVGKAASANDIKKAYRKLAKTNHPDLHPGDAEAERRFKEISQAYGVLGDETKRGRFDRGEIDADGNERVEHPFRGANAGGPGGYHYTTSRGDADLADIEDLFSNLFGGRVGGAGFGGHAGFGGRPRGPVPGQDVRYELAVDFLDAVNGATRRVTMADGVVLDVALPKGLRDSQTIRLKGKGRPGTDGAPAGDALVAVSVRGHPTFRLDGDNIHVTLPISLADAVLGGKARVPTISGEIALTVPESSNGGRVLRLKGRGVQRAGKPAGDQLVTLQITLPKTPDLELVALLRRQREALRESAEAEAA
jgi:DnaJ-class molecular chaperone